MSQSLADFAVLRCPNGPYIFCFKCTTITIALYKHVTGKPHNITNGRLSELLSTRPDLQAIVDASAIARRGASLPEALPDDVPPMAGLPVISGYECLVCPRASPHRSLSQSLDPMKRHIRQRHNMQYLEKLQGVHFRHVFIQTWFPQVRSGNGINWRVDFSRPQHPIYQQPVLDDSIKAHDAKYHTRLQQFFELGTMPLKAQGENARDSDSNSDSEGIPLPQHPLSEVQLTGTKLKDDKNDFIDQSGWRRAFKHLPYVQAMRQMTKQPTYKVPRRFTLRDVADKKGILSQDYSKDDDDPPYECINSLTPRQEAILQLILRAFKSEVMKRCKATLYTTHFNLRTWLVSYFPN
jgi:hypothetical protein